MRNSLKRILENLYQSYHIAYLSSDPLEQVRQYHDPKDQEIVGFIAALFALGQANLIKKAVNDLLGRMGDAPSRFVETFDPEQDKDQFRGFVYRFYREQDVGLLIFWIRQMLDSHGSIKAFFLDGYDSSEPDIGGALSRFVRNITKLRTEPFYHQLPTKGYRASHWLTNPTDGSGCKRLNLFLRWMVRHDGLDLGLWPEISPSKLIIPLDTYIARIGRNIGLTQRSTPDWKMAVEITQSLKQCDPLDPVKYDFALCHVGMLHSCTGRPDSEKCEGCPLNPLCSTAN